MQLLVDSGEFQEAFLKDLGASKLCVYAQTLSFEADAGGVFLADALKQRPELQRTLIVDHYCKYLINDKFLWSPKNFFDGALRGEYKATLKLLKELQGSGVNVQWVNPMGLAFRKITSRNHKKIIGFDNQSAYIGGINFSAHNFAWHDLMIRFDEKEIVDCLKNDFFATAKGENLGGIYQFHSCCLMFLDGQNSPQYAKPLIDLLDSAQKEIFVVSPYISSPFYEVLGRAVQRGVKVTLLAPMANNWGFYDEYTRWSCEQHGIDLRFYTGRMNHMKTMLVDNEALVVGSSNFDFFSFHLHQELMAIIRNEELIKDFKKRVVEVDLKLSKSVADTETKTLSLMAKKKLHRFFALMYFLSRLKRPPQINSLGENL